MSRGISFLQDLAKDYASAFFDFIKGYNIAITIEESYYLIDYAICSIYGVPCQWYTDGIRMYGQIAINHLNNSIVPNNMLSYEDRISLVSLSNSYLVAIFSQCC